MLSAHEGGVVRLHPKFVEKWARRYIKIYTEEGAVFAKRWATAFLDDNQRAAMSLRVKEIMNHNKKGPEKGP